MLLASDVGGTKTLLGLFSADTERPQPIEVGEFVTLDYDGLEPMVREFLGAWKVDARTITAACIGVAGAVTDQVARLTNVPWLVDGEAVAAGLGLKRAEVINDLEALAYAVPVLEPSEFAVLQQGIAVPGRECARSLRLARAWASRCCTTSTAASCRTRRRAAMPILRRGHRASSSSSPSSRASSAASAWSTSFPVRGSSTSISSRIGAFGTGPMITPNSLAPSQLCSGVGSNRTQSELPGRIYISAIEKRCPHCVEAVDMFIAAYGSEAGNLALRAMATAGVYIGGGIAPKILPSLESGLFMEAFRAKEPMAALVAMIPVSVILNPDAGLLGAAVRAMALTEGR